MQAAREENDRVVVSLFVNPTQFGKGEDFERYPRNLERDIELAAQVGVDVLFAPSNEEIYPRPGCSIQVAEVADLWEGEIRPHHFSGVATVVCKLFNIVRCDAAYFGQKDLQQCIVIQRVIADLNLPVRFSRQPTIRETDGLAMSSRNQYLSPEHRALAPMLYRQLSECREIIIDTQRPENDVDRALRDSASALEAAGFRVDYFELIELDSARPVREFSIPCALIVAAKIGHTRLIDNILI
jgi:pantoate--beta-alanine ligase